MTYREIFDYIYSGSEKVSDKINNLPEPDRSAFKIFRTLSGRDGFDYWWFNIEHDIQNEIFEEVKKEINQ